jgi:hypothetical protein
MTFLFASAVSEPPGLVLSKAEARRQRAMAEDRARSARAAVGAFLAAGPRR